MKTIKLIYVTLLLCIPGVESTHAESERLLYGEEEYTYSCAVCHGQDGTGNGPLAEFLTVEPADLTQLSSRNGGHFPFSRVLSTIDGRMEVKVHGPRAMPVWGARYKKDLINIGFGEEEANYISQGLILDLIIYLHSIQTDE